MWPVRRLILLSAAICALVLAAPASAQLNDYKNGGSVPTCKYSDKQLGGQLGDLPPDIEQYAPGYADELRNARGASCAGSGAGGGSGAGSNGASGGGGPGVESVPNPASGGGTDGGGPGGTDGSSGAAGATSNAKVDTPPAPKPEPRKRLANASSPAVTTRPSGPDAPLWGVILVAAVLLIGSALGAMYILGADFGRLARPLGAAAGEARARTSDRALQLWETVRFGR